ncbi:hypothetical protein EMQ25_17195 [Arsenicitalea aurantiaca]|uniref:Uncharacterized protein n=1 Tax=Arsenicitalea aurantiaca TaxID=1783274 RepID=A0A433X2R9_9HYPH|nr:hypothetical protein [Arsenicitalea aurantiaca]RUT28322.1 hypothetical protein EMQ25_17195 [Arsenicitalea aurantiaca]
MTKQKKPDDRSKTTAATRQTPIQPYDVADGVMTVRGADGRPHETPASEAEEANEALNRSTEKPERPSVGPAGLRGSPD